MTYRVGREIHFSYGHRLLGHPGKCARLHGHNARVILEIESEKLDRQGMVLDFYEIEKRIGAWIDQTLDHQMILAEKDPLVPVLKKAGEPLVLMKQIPTAEAIAQWIYEEAVHRGLPVAKVTLWETGHCFAVYQGGGVL